MCRVVPLHSISRVFTLCAHCSSAFCACWNCITFGIALLDSILTIKEIHKLISTLCFYTLSLFIIPTNVDSCASRRHTGPVHVGWRGGQGGHEQGPEAQEKGIFELFIYNAGCHYFVCTAYLSRNHTILCSRIQLYTYTQQKKKVNTFSRSDFSY